MALPDSFASTVPTAMSGMSLEHADSLPPAAGLKKRKREPMQEEVINLAHPTTTFSPSSFQHLNSTFRLDIPELDNCPPSSAPKYPSTRSLEDEISSRSRCLPRKRRLAQTHPPQQSDQLIEDARVLPSPVIGPQNNKLLSPTVCIPTTRDLSSPPISPKTLIPICYPNQQQQQQHQHQQCTSVTLLRPCHICHRRPTTREVLDAYADCDLCEKRACYICLRQCDSANCCGLGGTSNVVDEKLLPEDGCIPPREYLNDCDLGPRRQRKICSSCAVEGVTDTGLEVVRCLDCVRGQLSHWQTVPPGSTVPIQ